MRPGPRNLITDVAGIKIGNAEDHDARSGVTVILPDEPATAAVDVRGGGPGTRETDALASSRVVEQIHGLTLSGGSAFGLDAGSGLITWLAARGRGFRIGDACVPVVPGAILFDLLNGGNKDWGDEPPFRTLARRAADMAGEEFALGNSGAGLGARGGASERRAGKRVDRRTAGLHGRGPGCLQLLRQPGHPRHRLFLGLGAGDGQRIRRPAPANADRAD